MTKSFSKVLLLALAAALCLSACCGKKCNKDCKCDDCCKDGACCCETQFSRKPNVGFQAYTLRHELEKDFYGTLKAARELGYNGVEFYGEYYGHSILEVKRWCTELGLIPFSNHIPYQQMIDDLDKVIAENTALGVQYIAFPYMAEEGRPGVNPEQFKAIVAKLGEIGAKVRQSGIQLLYHNHDFEFVNLPDGKVAYYDIFDKNERENLQVELDICWADYSGFNPAEVLTKYAGAIPVVHVKDYKLEGKLSKAPYALIGVSTDNSMKDEGGWFEYRPLGCGQVDIPGTLKAAIDGGMQWLCVEQDEPSMGLDPIGSLAKSAEYLKTLGLM